MSSAKTTIAQHSIKSLETTLHSFELNERKENQFLRSLLFYIIGYMMKSPRFISALNSGMQHALNQVK